MHYYIALATILLLQGCKNTSRQQETPGKQLARTYCGSCHLFPEPSLLDKTTWKEKVLPPMAKLLGIDNVFEMPLENTSQKNPIPVQDWKKVLGYYMSQAPDKMPDQERPPIKDFTHLFSAKKIDVPPRSFPSISFLKIDPGNHRVYAGNATDSSFVIFDEDLRRVSEQTINGVLVDVNFTNGVQQPGKRSGYLTKIGIMNPNDLKSGSVERFDMDKRGNLINRSEVLSGLPRPVETSGCDLDKDGRQDLLVCGFGNSQGALYWMKNNGKLEHRVLRALPGAIKSYIDDFNHDGLPDIMVLMAQADEGIFLLLNKGDGLFETKTLLQFPPVYGSSYFELDDFNGDGYPDILYTCGDNADYSSDVLKNYHGVYIFLNDGHNVFTRKFFFPLHGCFKAMAGDFDKDGDLDIAAISYFPDTRHQPQESFVYLEQEKELQFRPSSINEYNAGRWLTMDVNDIDGDGDKDIVLGSLVPPVAAQQLRWKNSGVQRSQIVLLRNNH